MGVYHFVGLGKSPGAVTTGLSYIKHEIGDSPDLGNVVQGVVIFTSPEIANGQEPAYPTVYNEYMQRNVRQQWAEKKKNSLQIVAEYLKRDIGEGEFYVCELDVNDFDACFETVAKAMLKFHPPGSTGKNIWANLTGGSNILNAAIMQTAYVSGFISQIYYTFVSNLREDGQYLQPFSNDKKEFDYRRKYVVKTIFDERYQRILEELERLEGEAPGYLISSADLLSRLKGADIAGFTGLSLETFRRNYLNTMPGVGRKGNRTDGQDDENFLNEDGRQVLTLLRSPWFKALVRQDETSSSPTKTLITDLKIRSL
ncbi:MAG: hypothetical protein WA821_19975 [Anaerolineales bacterium]